MSTVVGLVKSRLQSRSRRGKSVDGFEITLNEAGYLVRHKSLRQEALAEPTEEDFTISPVRTNVRARMPRTPNEIDPSTLVDTLQYRSQGTKIPPVPSIPTLPETAFPARHSSLHTSRIAKDPRWAASQNQLDQEAPLRRRHNTISSPAERPRHIPQSGYFDQLPNPGPTGPTRTARLFGSIAENRTRKSLDSQDRDTSRTIPSKRRSQEMANTGKAIQEKPLPDRPALDTLDSLASLKLSLPPIEPLTPLQLNRTKTNPDLPEHVRLPSDSNFRPGFTERTSVEEVVHPAVEKEIVQRRIHEIVQPEIERDVHVHHYYEYEQPLHVSEVLPPKHYRLDTHTGEKIEIEAPSYWSMPRSMSPSRADVSGVKGAQRHYVVDEVNPYGVLEQGPRQEQIWI